MLVVYEVPELDKKVYPIVLLPKERTCLGSSPRLIRRTNLWCNDDFGNKCHLYSGPLMAVAVDEPVSAYLADEAPYEEACPEKSASVFSLDSNDIDQMPIVFADSSPVPLYNQSKVWIDPIRSPFVYNNYDPSMNKSNSFNQTNNYIMVQNNVTQIFNGQSENTNDSRPKRSQSIKPVYEELEDYYNDDSEGDQYLPELVSRKKKRVSMRYKTSTDKNEGKALKQLLSTESTCKQRKTILFLGKDSKTGHTIQNISYDDPMIKCSEIDVDHEVTIEDTTSLSPSEPKKKKFQCDKCKQIFEHISSFHQHMKGKHTSPKTTRDRKEALRCSDCGRNFKTYQKYQKHCRGHGDPEVECPKCHKVYSSTATLKVHTRIHERKFPCSYCTRSYATPQTYRTHMKKSHLKFLCEYDTCSYVATSETVLNDHLSDHIYNLKTQIGEIQNKEIQDQEIVDQEIQDQNVEEDELIQDQQVLEETIEDQIAQNDQIVYLEDNGIDLKEIDQTQDINEYIDHMELEQINKSNVFDLAEEFPDDFSDVDFDQDSVLMDDIKNEMEATNFTESRGVEERKRIREADSVIAKIMSSKIFLLDSKKAKKYAKKSKSNKTCTCCSKSFDRVTDLKRHLIEHMVKSTLAKTVSSVHGFLDIVCEVCQEESFDSVDKYKAHLRMHAHLTTYKCTLCDKSFSDSSNFSKHKKIHGVSYYQCDLCNRRFNSKIMLSRHIEYHNNHKPLQCNLCDRYFHFESMLNKHFRTAHKLTASSFKCKFCEIELNSLREKWDHEWMMHNIRKAANDCELCEARFRKFSELKRHCNDVHNINVKRVRAMTDTDSGSKDYFSLRYSKLKEL